jgi:lipopolysaccharide export system ATP-binding protein
VITDRAVLEVDGIGKRFGGLQVLKAASFAGWAGRITVLMGRNGAGKSTLFRISVGRVRADYGRVMYKGEFLARPSLPRLARRGLMYSSQDSSLTRLFSIRAHVDTVARTFGARDRVEGIVKRLSLAEILDRKPQAVSGGERRRASLALAMIRSPDCLLMDEPFAGIDPADREMVASGLTTLRNAGAAVVISGHDVEDLLQVADEVIWVAAGTTHWLGGPVEAQRHDQFRREYLGPRGRPEG